MLVLRLPFLVELEFGNVGFLKRRDGTGRDGTGRDGVPGEKPLGAKGTAYNKLSPLLASTPGFDPGPPWLEASSLTTTPPLLLFE